MHKTNNNYNINNSKNNKNKIDVKKIFSDIGTVANVLGKILTTSKSFVDELQNQSGILYVFDTNALMNEPNLISIPKRNSSYIVPIVVLEELDKLKLDKNRSQKASNAIKAINKSNVRIEKYSEHALPKDFDMRNNDNKILATAMKFSNKNVVIVTDDNNLKNKAKSQNIKYMSLSEFKRIKN
ncbi:PIN domain-containing protein [Brachyspira intermedia]|uniref:PIN domain-containing protein n=1 Tax=Brachyspira intermedia TaxID=84377 RepID=UPI003003CB53